MLSTKYGLLTYAGFTYTLTGLFANNVFSFSGIWFILFYTHNTYDIYHIHLSAEAKRRFDAHVSQ
jgi:hypothetical protein